MCKTTTCNKPGKSYCASCSIRRFKERHPERYCYFVWRNNARARGKVFEISFEYFLKFARRTDYMNKKGIKRTSMHIDRIKEELGYVEGNIQPMKNHLNVKKYVAYKGRDECNKPQFKTQIHGRSQIDNTDESYPF